MLFKRSIIILTLAITVVCLSISGTQADPAYIHNYQTNEPAVATYTLEELQNAKPLPLPTVVMPEGADSPSAILMEKSRQEPVLPMLAPGWDPESGIPPPDPRVGYTITKDHPLYKVATGGADFQTFGSAPTDPLYGPYSPFQRWTWYGNYISQNTQMIGKLYFDTNNDGIRDASCTASVIGSRTIATAAHCLHSGGSSGRWYSRFLFCPSYYKAGGSGGPHPSRGCWSWTSATVSMGWYNNSALDRDYACIVTSLTGDTIANRVGYVTGWAGRAWNWSSKQPMVSWGYPGADPFPGYHIIVASSPEWYEVDMTPGDGQVSKYIGNDMTGGSSGGPWWMSVRHRTAEYNDTDGFSHTDPPGCSNCVPGGPYINGVNSHKRCKNSCFTPPTSDAGTYWQEMGSPQFRSTPGDGDESEDIFSVCFNNE